jgi:hypothetical protein
MYQPVKVRYFKNLNKDYRCDLHVAQGRKIVLGVLALEFVATDLIWRTFCI